MKGPSIQVLRAIKTRGFALVVTLSLMILLTIIAVGLLTLSSISLRASSASAAMSEARQNARMAMMLALGELQKQAGPDQRITATANIAGDAAGLQLGAGASPANDKSINGIDKGLKAVQSGTRHWTGVWKNSNTTATVGTEIYTKTPSPSIVQWLISGSDASSSGPTILPSDSKYAVSSSGKVSNPEEAVILAGEKTVGASATDRYVVAPVLEMTDKNAKVNGRFAWWVGDEGVKAKINIATTNTNSASYASLAAQRRGWETVDGFTDYPTPSSGGHTSLPKIISLPETALLVPSANSASGGSTPLQAAFHSATADSRAVIADVLNGGTKIDLTAILSGGLPNSKTVSSIANYPVKGTNIVPTTVASKMKAPRWDAIKDFYDRSGQLSGGSLIVRGATSDFTSSIAPLITDFRILMGAKIIMKDAKAGTCNINPWGKIAVAIANPYSYPLKWEKALEIELRNQTPSGNNPSRIWGNLPDPKPAYLPNSPTYPAAEAAVFNNAIFRINPASLAPGEIRAYTVGSNIKRPAKSTARVNIDLTSLSSSAPNLANNYVELENTSIYTIDNLSNKRLELDIRESWQTTLAMVEMGLASTPSSSRLLRKIERFELDNGYFMANQRQYDKSQAAKITQPFPLMLYSFQISQPGGPYKDYMPSSYAMGQRGSTLRTFADFNLQATRIRKPIASYNPPPYFAESNDNKNQLGGDPPDGTVGQGFSRNLLIPRWGRSPKDGGGKAILFSIPSQLSTLAQLQHADLTGDDLGASLGHQPGNAFGNSYATPFVKRNVISQTRTSYELVGNNNHSATNNSTTSYYDISHLLNTALWDSYFFSTIPSSGSAIPENPTLVRLNPNDTSGDLKDPVAAASLLMIDGAFNVNSTDKNAWKAYLASAKHFNHAAGAAKSSDAAFPRSLEQTSASAELPTGNDEDSFTGFRSLTDSRLDALAEEIVKQVRLRGPFVSVSHFVNRALAKLTTQPALTHSGALQSAIDDSGANITYDEVKKAYKTDFKSIDPKIDSVTLLKKSGAPRADYDGGLTLDRPTSVDSVNPDWATTSTDRNFGAVASIIADREMLKEGSDSQYTRKQGFRSTGIPGWLTQADVLQVIGASITARSDTFRIRSFGEAVDAQGNTIAKAYCEAIIQRTPSYVDPTNPPSTRGTDLSDLNKAYGRQFQIVSFRWLSPQEI